MLIASTFILTGADAVTISAAQSVAAMPHYRYDVPQAVMSPLQDQHCL
jgi:hypothetical protein